MTTTAKAPRTLKITSREDWLNRFVQHARPVFAAKGFPIPAKVRVSIGFTSNGAKGRAIGECWSDAASADGSFEIFIVPGQDDGAEVAAILTHELAHAAVGLAAGHGPKFGKAARALGLVGKLTATTAGPEWDVWARPILKRMGDLPHAKLRGMSSGPKKQTTRMLKATCNACGFTVRGTKQWLCETDADGTLQQRALVCPTIVCQGVLVVELPDADDADEVPGE